MPGNPCHTRLLPVTFDFYLLHLPCALALSLFLTSLPSTLSTTAPQPCLAFNHSLKDTLSTIACHDKAKSEANGKWMKKIRFARTPMPRVKDCSVFVNPMTYTCQRDHSAMPLRFRKASPTLGLREEARFSCRNLYSPWTTHKMFLSHR